MLGVDNMCPKVVMFFKNLWTNSFAISEILHFEMKDAQHSFY